MSAAPSANGAQRASPKRPVHWLRRVACAAGRGGAATSHARPARAQFAVQRYDVSHAFGPYCFSNLHARSQQHHQASPSAPPPPDEPLALHPLRARTPAAFCPTPAPYRSPPPPPHIRYGASSQGRQVRTPQCQQRARAPGLDEHVRHQRDGLAARQPHPQRRRRPCCRCLRPANTPPR